MRVEYLGHSAFLLEGEGGEVLIDPYLKGNPLASTSGEDLEPDLILVTHAHHDHLGDAIGISRRTGAHILTTPEIAAYCQEEGAEVIAAHMGAWWTGVSALLRYSLPGIPPPSGEGCWECHAPS